MEGYAYSYPDSGDSSPRSREIDFENPPSSWDDPNPNSNPNPTPHKVKFLVSYGGKIQPRPHDNLLSYLGGETKILAVDRHIKFTPLLSKLTSLISEDPSISTTPQLTSFRYQLPGEDLDALISVTNDDDLEHMMHEYDRLYRGPTKPARLRLFAFPNTQQPAGFGSGSSDPIPPVHAPIQVPTHPHPPNNVDFLFGLENNRPPAPVHHHHHDPVGHFPDRVVASDPQIDARIQELNRLQISAHEQHQQQQQQQPVVPPVYRPKSEDNFVSGGFPGDGYQKPPPTIPTSVQVPAGYWQQQGPPPPQQQALPTHSHQQQQPVYMVHAPAPGNVFHTPAGVRQLVNQPPPPQPQPQPQGYYQVQRVPQSDPYREPPVYSVAPPQAPVPTVGAPAMSTPAKVGGFSEAVGGPVRPGQAGQGLGENTGGYQVAYDSATGRQVYFAAPGGAGVGTTAFQGGDVVPPPPVAGGGLNNSKGKMVTKVSPTSAGM